MIRKILVPTDFSKSSQRAFEWACFVAKALSAHVHLYHRIEPPASWLKKADESSDFQIDDYILEMAKKLAAIKELDNAEGIQVTTSYSSGALMSEIENLMKQEGFELIIMGAHGQSGYQSSTLGSNTVKAVRKIHSNILIVKEDSLPGPIRNVMFASGLNENDRPVFRWFTKFIEQFGAKHLHVMSVNTGSYFSQPTIVMEEALKEFAGIAKKEVAFPVETHFYKNASVLSGIQKFSKEEQVDLIAIPNHERHPLKRIFLGSTVETLVQVSRCPVFCLDHPQMEL